MRAYIFDIDDTMFVRSGPFVKVIGKDYPAEKYPTLPHELPELVKFYTEFRDRGDYYYNNFFACGKMSEEEMYLRRTKDVFAAHGVELNDEQAMEFHYRYLENQKHIDLMDGMGELLDELLADPEKYFVGILTNGNYDRQHVKMHSLGLDRRIPEERIIVTGAVNLHKPDPKIFALYEERVLKPAGISRGDCTYIGDAFGNDIRSSHAAGWKNVWVNWQREDEKDADACADRIAYNVEDLREYLLHA